MTRLTVRLQQYIAIRRSLGFDMSFEERVLRRFAEFADGEHADRITVDLFLRWKKQYGSANNNTWCARLSMVRVFARWLQSVDPRTEIPPPGLISAKWRRPRPYIYTDDQIAAIVTETARLRSPYGLPGWTCSTLFGLIAVTGLRVNEALGLDDGDVDLKEAVLTIKRGKNRRYRFLPISPGAAERLRTYRVERNRLLGAGRAAFFILDNGERPSGCCAQHNFALVCQRIGLRERQAFHRHGHGPRIHDLRHTHTFAVRTIIDWYRCGLDPDREMYKLSTYLGHTKPELTYWYIEAIPELLQLASERAERNLAGRNAR
jgi:integrase/recombinase XerD